MVSGAEWDVVEVVSEVPPPANSVLNPAQPADAPGEGLRCGASSAFDRLGLPLHLEVGDILCRAGELKSHVHRVEAGRLFARWHHPETGSQVVSFAFAGDVVGLGQLPRHGVTVEAAANTVVRCVPRTLLADVLAENEQLAAQHTSATETELALLRETLVSEGRTHALVRVAALLSVLAANSGYEGRGADVVADDFTCGYVAEQLGLDIETLKGALVDLGQRGLIEPLPGGGLRLCDPTELDRLASGINDLDTKH